MFIIRMICLFIFKTILAHYHSAGSTVTSIVEIDKKEFQFIILTIILLALLLVIILVANKKKDLKLFLFIDFYKYSIVERILILLWAYYAIDVFVI